MKPFCCKCQREAQYRLEINEYRQIKKNGQSWQIYFILKHHWVGLDLKLVQGTVTCKARYLIQIKA